MGVESLVAQLDRPVEDVDEEVFELFSQNQNESTDLGFVDSQATTLTVSLGDGAEVTVAQSPGLLHSNLKTGTTGAVLWRVSPLIARWVRRSDNILFSSEALHYESTVLELGCGISGVIALAMAPKIGKFVCTDQRYILKQLTTNLAENISASPARREERSRKRHGSSSGASTGFRPKAAVADDVLSNIQALELDWENTSLNTLASAIGDLSIRNLDLVIACDCIYNNHLIEPFVMACTEVCRARYTAPVLCLVAQQLRSDDVFREWLAAFSREFVTWRVPDRLLDSALREGKGYVVHVGILRSVATELPSALLAGTDVEQKP